MLEDDFNDVLTKAVRGTGFDISSLGLNAKKLQLCLNGTFDEEVISTLAPALELDTSKLLLLPQYETHITLPIGVKKFISPFGHLGVNSYVVEEDEHILIFDTGTDAHNCICHLAMHQDKEKYLFITHPHPDHIGCEQTLRSHVTNCAELKPNISKKFGKLTLKTIDVAGHHPEAMAYFIEGLETPICIIGDAIFAGSVGGVAPSLYKKALSNIKENILSLPPETLLLSGHGPSTSVELEIQNNPFF